LVDIYFRGRERFSFEINAEKTAKTTEVTMTVQEQISQIVKELENAKRDNTRVGLVRAAVMCLHCLESIDVSDKQPITALARQIERSGIKQNVIAAKLGISPAAVSLQVKSGIRMIRTAKDYARVLNCDSRLLMEF